jgi:hypothetical protein
MSCWSDEWSDSSESELEDFYPLFECAMCTIPLSRSTGIGVVVLNGFFRFCNTCVKLLENDSGYVVSSLNCSCDTPLIGIHCSCEKYDFSRFIQIIPGSCDAMPPFLCGVNGKFCDFKRYRITGHSWDVDYLGSINVYSNVLVNALTPTWIVRPQGNEWRVLSNAFRRRVEVSEENFYATILGLGLFIGADRPSLNIMFPRELFYRREWDDDYHEFNTFVDFLDIMDYNGFREDFLNTDLSFREVMGAGARVWRHLSCGLTYEMIVEEEMNFMVYNAYVDKLLIQCLMVGQTIYGFGACENDGLDLIKRYRH